MYIEGYKRKMYPCQCKVLRITGPSFRAPFSKNVLQGRVICMFGLIAHLHGFIRGLYRSKCVILLLVISLGLQNSTDK